MRGSSIVVIAVGFGLLAAGCSGSPGSKPGPGASSGSGSAAHGSASAPAVPTASIAITPANGSKNVNPTAGVAVSVARGSIDSVTVRAADGSSVPGSATGGGWHTSWALGVSQTYTVTAIAKSASGQQVTLTSKFSTLTPSSTFITQIFEGYNETYGVGMPVILTFSQPITDKAAVERALSLTTSKPVIGAWYWDGSQSLVFRPRDYWPANTTVSFTGHLNGVEGAPGMYGHQDLTQSFRIGRSLIAVASTTTHRTHIYLNGKLTYNWPVSTGRTTLPTPDGTYLSVEKANPVRMIGGGSPGSAGYYNELVNYAVRFTYSGDYYHSAPWSVVSQGTSNVSHGCVNLAPEDAVIYYNMSIPGDPITITDSTAPGKWDDGWTEWFLTWSQLVAGSALHQAVSAGPSGSTFVDPSTVPADSASIPTGTSAAGNFHIGAGL